jgi:hypothetical protein
MIELLDKQIDKQVPSANTIVKKMYKKKKQQKTKNETKRKKKEPKLKSNKNKKHKLTTLMYTSIDNDNKKIKNKKSNQIKMCIYFQ